MNYNVGTTPNYNAPVMDFSSFFSPQNQQQAQQGHVGFMDALHKFLLGPNGQQMIAPGSAVPGAAGPTSAGGPQGPMPLVGQPMLLPSNPPVQPIARRPMPLASIPPVPNIIGNDRGDY
jgi:hypothetical protein